MSLFLLNVKDSPRTGTTHQLSFPKNQLRYRLIFLHVSDVYSRSDLVQMATGSGFDPQQSLELRGWRRLVPAVPVTWHIGPPLYTCPAAG